MKNKITALTLLLSMLGLTLVSLFALPRLHTHYSLKQFLPANNPVLNEEVKSRQAFQISETQPFIVTAKIPNGQNWLIPEKISALEKLTKQILNFQGVENAVSLATVQGVINSEEGFNIGPFLQNISVQNWRKEVFSNDFITPSLISKNGDMVTVIVQSNSQSAKDFYFLRQKLEEMATQTLPFADVKIGGAPAVQSDVTTLLEKEIFNFVALSLLVCFLTMGFVFSNYSPLVITFVIVMCANIFVFAAMAIAGYSFTILSSTIPILTTVDVMSLCLHTFFRYAETRKKYPAYVHSEIVSKTLHAIMKPNLIASLTTMIGFLTLLKTDVPIMHDYGLTAGLSILIGLSTTMILIYPLLLFMPGPRARKWAWSKARWGLRLIYHSGFWIILVFIVAIALAFEGQNLSWSARLFDDLPKIYQASNSSEIIDKHLGGMVPFEIAISGPPESWSEPKNIAKLDSLTQQIRQRPGVGSTVSLPDLIHAFKSHSDFKNLKRQELSEIIFLYTLSNQSPLRNFLTADNASVRVSIRAQDLPANSINDLSRDLTKLSEAAFPKMKIKVFGMGPTVHFLNDQLSRDLIFGFWESMAAIGFMLLFVFKSLRWALVACIPNLVPPAVLLGTLAMTETPIKPSVAIIFSIALGLAFNNTVYLLERLRRFQKQKPSEHLPIEKSLWLEGNPCLISSLTILAGFSVFMASYFSMNRIFGLYMVLSILAGLIGDLVLLPSLLKLFPFLLKPLHLKKESMMSFAASSLLLLTIIMLPRLCFAESSDHILNEVNQRLTTRDEDFTAKMKTIEADGSSKEREMHIWRLSISNEEHSMKVRMLKPNDLKGTALLASIKGSQEDKWIFLPSTKQTRRLTGEKNQGGILGSEISAEDFEFNHEKSVPSQLKKEIEIQGIKFFVIEADVSLSSPSYSKVRTYITMADFLPMRAECFDKKGNLLKIIDFNSFKKISKNKWRPEKIKVQNVQNKRITEVILDHVKLNQNLQATKFTAKSLASE